MRAVTFQAPGEVRIDERPDPEPVAATDAVVDVEASGICGSDLHIYHGRVKIEPGFVIGHEYVGTVVATGDSVGRVREGDRVLGCFCAACGECQFCSRGLHQKCERGGIFGHGELLGSLQGAQAERLLVPFADVTLRSLPEGISDEVALFAGDVMGTAYHAVDSLPVTGGEAVAVLGLGPVGLCAVQAAKAAGASSVIAVDRVPERLEMAASFGATAVHLDEEDASAAVKAATDRRGVDLAVDAAGHPDALNLACRLARIGGTVSATGVYAEPLELHMGIVWLKSLTLKTGQANVIAHIDAVLDRLADGSLDPSPLVTHRMRLDEAPEAYAIYDRREALKIVLTP